MICAFVWIDKVWIYMNLVGWFCLVGIQIFYCMLLI